MATIFAHSLVGATIACVTPFPKKTKTFLFWMSFLPVVPDLDYFSVFSSLLQSGVWSHRGLSHSVLFCGLFSMLAVSLSYKKIGVQKPFRLFLLYFAALISHPVLDAVTNGGPGIAFYAPYNMTRYFFSWRPLEVSPLGLSFFSERGLVVLISEFFWIFLPCLCLVLAKVYLSKRSMNQDKVGID